MLYVLVYIKNQYRMLEQMVRKLWNDIKDNYNKSYGNLIINIG